MTFTLYVDEARWRAHLAATVAATPDIVPVIKGNGYGLGNARLAAEAARLGVDTVAVGTVDELPAVRDGFPGDVLVLTPSYPAPFEDPTGRVVQSTAPQIPSDPVIAILITGIRRTARCVCQMPSAPPRPPCQRRIAPSGP